MNLNNKLVFRCAICFIISIFGCNQNNTLESDCPPLRPNIAASPYGCPVWSTDGETIAFSHTPLKRIYQDPDDCLYYYEFEHDSSGFWMIYPDGSHRRRVLPFSLGSPDWSADGEWIAFERGGQIYKIRVDENGFDIASLLQLTFEGSNFYPTWSPDEGWIAYESTIGDSVGIWILRADGSGLRRYFVFGSQPNWMPNGTAIAYGNRGIWIEAVDHSFKKKIQTFEFERLDNFKVSPDGTMMAFSLQPTNGVPNLWIMNSNGSILRQLTSEGVGLGISWRPDSKEIVYVSYRTTDYSYANGTLWIINVETRVKKQLTFNFPP